MLKWAPNQMGNGSHGNLADSSCFYPFQMATFCPFFKEFRVLAGGGHGALAAGLRVQPSIAHLDALSPLRQGLE